MHDIILITDEQKKNDDNNLKYNSNGDDKL